MLSKRLNTLALMIDPCDQMCDVGSDHALLPIALLKSHKVKKAFVVEVASGPLEKAQIEVANQGVMDQVEFFLSNGLREVNREICAVVIAGMGFDTISMILSDSLDKFKKIDQIILQSNSKQFELREFLSQNHFEILDEVFIQDRKRHYIAMKCRYNDQALDLSEHDCLCGPILIKKDNQDYLNYLLNQFKLYKDFLINDALRYQSKVDILESLLKSKGLL